MISPFLFVYLNMKYNEEIDKGLSEFINSTFIRRTGEIAEIIVDYYEGKPVRLIGFSTDANKNDFEIFEEGYYYWNELKIFIENENKTGN